MAKPRTACSTNNQMSQGTLLAILRLTNGGPLDLLESLGLDEWSITSFNSITRDVCINLKDQNMASLHMHLNKAKSNRYKTELSDGDISFINSELCDIVQMAGY